MAGQLGLVAFGLVLSLFASVYLFGVARRQRAAHTMRRRLGGLDRARSSLLRADESVSSLQRLLAESGLGWSTNDFWVRTLGGGALGLLVGAVLAGPGLGALFLAAGALAAYLFARRAHARRLAKCDEQMPQALEIVALALRAGHPLPAAISIAAGEAPNPIADELRRCAEEHDLGRPVEDVLLALGQRLPGSEAVHTFVVAVLVLAQTGGNIIAVIDRIVENARSRAQYRAKLRALTAEGRSSANMLALMPLVFGALAASVDPTYVDTLLFTSGGNVVFLSTIGLWLTGVLWTRRLVRTEA